MPIQQRALTQAITPGPSRRQHYFEVANGFLPGKQTTNISDPIFHNFSGSTYRLVRGCSKQVEGRAVDTDYQVGSVPHMISWGDWLAVQKGAAFSSTIIAPTTPRYIQNGGDLARYVHLDALYEAYLN